MAIPDPALLCALPSPAKGSMRRLLAFFLIAVALGFCQAVPANVSQRVVDIPTRPGVTQRFVYLAPEKPRAAVILFAGGHGGLQISPDGKFGWGEGKFLVRSRRLFSGRGLAVVVMDAPSDRQNPPYLGGYRQTPKHVADVKAVITWIKKQGAWPVWLVGTSVGTYSAAYVAAESDRDRGGLDGLALTSTILTHDKIHPVPALPLEKRKIPVLVAHHEQDACPYCAYADMPRLMEKLGTAGKRKLLTCTGGRAKGDPCDAFHHHGYYGIEKAVVEKIAAWILFN